MVIVERRVKIALWLWRSVEIAVLLFANTSVRESVVGVVLHEMVTRPLEVIGVIWNTSTDRAFLVVALEDITT